jgi:hypothetical protein
MSESKGIRAASLFVGVLLCMVSMQTAFAAWSIPDLNTITGNGTTSNMTISNITTSNVTTWNITNGSVSPSDLMNISIPSSNLMNFSIQRNRMQLPRINR